MSNSHFVTGMTYRLTGINMIFSVINMVFNVTMVAFWMPLLMNKATNTVMDDG